MPLNVRNLQHPVPSTVKVRVLDFSLFGRWPMSWLIRSSIRAIGPHPWPSFGTFWIHFERTRPVDYCYQKSSSTSCTLSCVSSAVYSFTENIFLLPDSLLNPALSLCVPYLRTSCLKSLIISRVIINHGTVMAVFGITRQALCWCLSSYLRSQSSWPRPSTAPLFACPVPFA